MSTINVFTTSPIEAALEPPPLIRKSKVSSSEFSTRKLPSIYGEFLDASAQKKLVNHLEETITKIGALQSQVNFYNERFQKQDPKLVEDWGREYRDHYEKDEATSREYIHLVQTLKEDIDKRQRLLQQNVQDMRFLQAFFQQEWTGNVSSFSFSFRPSSSLLFSWQARYGVDYRTSQMMGYVGVMRGSTVSKETSPSGEVGSVSPMTVVMKSEGTSEELDQERVFAQLQDLIEHAVTLKEYILVYTRTLDQQSHPEVARSAYLKILEIQEVLQKKFKNNAEFIQNAKQNLEKQLATERVLSTPDVPLLEGKLRKLEILQERLKLRLQELQAHLSGMKSRFKWTEEQLQAPIAIELETLSESTILREVVSFKEVLEVAQKETTLFSKEQVQDWIQQGETLQAKAKKTREQFSQAARLINTQEKTICAWLQSIEDLHRQMQEGMEVLSKSLKERQGWKEILSKLKPILAQSREGEFDKEICLDLTATAVRVSEPEDASTEPKTPILTSLTSERTVIDPKSSTPVFEKRFSNLDTRFFPRKSSERSIKTRPETPKQVHWYKKEDSCSESPEGIFSSWSHTLPQESEQEALERGDRERIRIQELEYKESKKRS